MSRSRVVTEFHAQPGQDATFLFDQGAPCKIVCSGSGSTRVIASESYPVIPEQYRFPTEPLGSGSDSDEGLEGLSIARGHIAIKICKTCQVEKPTDEYIQCGRSKKTNTPYYRSSCKVCMKHSMR